MTLSAPTRLKPLRAFRRANFEREPAAQLRAPAGTVIPFPSTQATRVQHILMVEFTSPDGGAWQAIGGGDTLADAIAFAQDSCPSHTTWQSIHWADLYGD